MTEKKPERTLELHVDIDAPLEAAWKAITEGKGIANWFAPIAEVSGEGVGATVTAGWSDEMMMSHTVAAWEPLTHLRLVDDSGWMGEGTSLATDYHLSTENGKTRVRLVQSAFGASDGWDDLFDGIKTGWVYFLQNLRIYLERLQGRTRRMITDRIEVDIPRQKFWRHLLSDAGGFVTGGAGALKAGDSIQVKISEPGTVRAVVEMLVEGQGLGLRIPEFTDALLFIELEGKKDKFHVGYWFSVYDEAQAKALEAPAKRAFRRIHESLPK
jgi:uncharacterized protein YndB with AHSA1/START domain